MTGENPRVASPQDRDTEVDILVSAFHDDPTWSWAFPNPPRRSEQHRRLWSLFVGPDVVTMWRNSPSPT